MTAVDARHISVGQWDGLSRTSKERLARRLAAVLGSRASFLGIEGCRHGNHQRMVAKFTVDGRVFLFVPGGRVRLGFDVARFVPSPEQSESYRESVDAVGLEPDLRSYLRRVLTPVRHVVLHGLLVEAEAQEVGLQPVALDAPELKAPLKKYPQGFESVRDEAILRVRRAADGSLVACRIVNTTREQLLRAFEADGCRLPSRDEWEHMCGAGGHTLFRWGNRCPCDRYPHETEPSADNRMPNAFGLKIAMDPYIPEVVREVGVLRGGDGGANVCLGAGYFLGWVPLATAYEDQEIAAQGLEGEALRGMLARRVVDVGAGVAAL